MMTLWMLVPPSMATAKANVTKARRAKAKAKATKVRKARTAARARSPGHKVGSKEAISNSEVSTTAEEAKVRSSIAIAMDVASVVTECGTATPKVQFIW